MRLGNCAAGVIGCLELTSRGPSHACNDASTRAFAKLLILPRGDVERRQVGKLGREVDGADVPVCHRHQQGRTQRAPRGRAACGSCTCGDAQACRASRSLRPAGCT